MRAAGRAYNAHPHSRMWILAEWKRSAMQVLLRREPCASGCFEDQTTVSSAADPVRLRRRYYDITANAISTVLSQQAAGLTGPAVLIDTDPVSMVSTEL